MYSEANSNTEIIYFIDGIVNDISDTFVLITNILLSL